MLLLSDANIVFVVTNRSELIHSQTKVYRDSFIKKEFTPTYLLTALNILLCEIAVFLA